MPAQEKRYQTIRSQQELERIFTQAREERWTELQFFDSDSEYLLYSIPWKIAPERAFGLERSLSWGLIDCSRIPSLTKLMIDGLDVADRGAAALGGLANLTALSLRHNSITELNLWMLASLTDLILDGNPDRVRRGAGASLAHQPQILELAPESGWRRRGKGVGGTYRPHVPERGGKRNQR